MRNNGPGPGQVREFAEKIQYWTRETKRIEGVKAAIAWVMDGDTKNPITGRSGSQPPDMKAIAETVKKADGEPQADDRMSSEYCAGVRECLEWIGGAGAEPEEWQ
ncbi:hypothetical protein FHS29_000444 [Saccharothrix tamanrassetensis]|uniref:Uncharacterized protein n=1 Tax=Saccharothrix tamanrassetensis TaxID=1051531 RepID=A0A841CBY7_9PSEU|nr:hypothetical protein [Saccharothrix tamanrassetensis]MBB5953874.1 hypothetical protein [Saccharothrix tamanrassetensis]